MNTDGKLPLEYAKIVCDTMIKKFEAPKLPSKGMFHYHQRVLL